MGLRIVSNKLLLDAAIPTGIPIIIQNITAVKIIAKVVIVSFQRSTRSIEIKARTEKIANFKPFVFQAKNAKIKGFLFEGGNLSYKIKKILNIT